MSKNGCFWTVALDKTLESPLDCKEIKRVNPKGNKSWIFIRRTDGEGEVPTRWPPDLKSHLIRKGPDAGKDWREEEKGMTEDEIVGWHDWLNGHEFEQAPGDGEGQGSQHPAVHGAEHNWMTEQQQGYLISVITHLLGKPFLLGLQREPYLREVYREKNAERNYVLFPLVSWSRFNLWGVNFHEILGSNIYLLVTSQEARSHAL